MIIGMELGYVTFIEINQRKISYVQNVGYYRLWKINVRGWQRVWVLSMYLVLDR